MYIQIHWEGNPEVVCIREEFLYKPAPGFPYLPYLVFAIFRKHLKVLKIVTHLSNEIRSQEITPILSKIAYRKLQILEIKIEQNIKNLKSIKHTVS